MKLAVTSAEPATTKLHVPVEQPAPVHPVKIESPAAVAVSASDVPGGYASEQSAPQLMPTGLDVTVPVPVPVRDTATVPLGANVAWMVVGPVMVVVHTPVPMQPPSLQPRNCEPALTVAVSVIEAPCGTIAAHMPGQAMGPVVEATVPSPVMSIITGYWATSKVAVTVVAASTDTVQVVTVPVQPPPAHPANTAPAEGAAVRVTS
ncbi:MAG: hypothetical protein R3B06_19585 [Kofleriaceae bacterium]